MKESRSTADLTTSDAARAVLGAVGWRCVMLLAVDSVRGAVRRITQSSGGTNMTSGVDETPSDPRIVAIATVAPLWGIHYGSDLEVAADHMDRGDEVHVLTCRGGLTSCVANPAGDRIACMFCRGIQRRGLAALGVPSSRVHVVPRVRSTSTLPVDSFTALRDHRPKQRTGGAAASALVSYLLAPEPAGEPH